MRRHISQAELLRLAATLTMEGGATLRDALDPASVELLAATTVRASDLLPTYRVRRDRWRKEGTPPSVGLEAFVAAIEEQGSSVVALVGYEHSESQFVMLLGQDLSELLGIVVIGRQ